VFDRLPYQVGQAVEHVQELRTSSKCRPVVSSSDVQRLSRVGTGKLGGQLDALGLATGECRRLMSEEWPNPTSDSVADPTDRGTLTNNSSAVAIDISDTSAIVLP
jgi:hypothetical protein